MGRARILLVLLALGCHRAALAPGAGVPAGAGGVAPAESIALSGHASSRTVLAAAAVYLLKAEGTVTVGGRGLDAEHALAGAEARDVVDGVDVGVDVGMKQVLPATGRKAAPPSRDRLRWIGDARRDHVYYLLVTGAGAPLSLDLIPPPGAAGAPVGRLTVSLYRLHPAPPALAAPVETVMVPAREKMSVRSAIKCPPGALYLLQAVGEVQVGGPGAMGDAEFHDYHADGRGYNEGEAGVDFGVGVDESGVGTPGGPTTGSQHPQRRHKWGAFRVDHTYYLLYAGTGDSIALNYHDSGGKSGIYKDNEGFLPVSIFALP
jgi:hypothetical protein